MNTSGVWRRESHGMKTCYPHVHIFPTVQTVSTEWLTINICWVSDLIALLGKEGDDVLHGASESPMIANK